MDQGWLKDVSKKNLNFILLDEIFNRIKFFFIQLSFIRIIYNLLKQFKIFFFIFYNIINSTMNFDGNFGINNINANLKFNVSFNGNSYININVK